MLLLTQGPRGRKVSVVGGVRLNGSIQTSDGVPAYPDGWTMAQLAAYLSDVIERPVLDRTELPGRFGITLDYSRGAEAMSMRASRLLSVFIRVYLWPAQVRS